jgi:hypothetical protein
LGKGWLDVESCQFSDNVHLFVCPPRKCIQKNYKIMLRK